MGLSVMKVIYNVSECAMKFCNYHLIVVTVAFF